MILGAIAVAPGRSAEPAALAFIDLRYTDDGIEVLGKALAVTDIQLKGEMTVSRKGASGSVSTRQGSDLLMTKGQSAEIARVNVSYQAGDRIDVKVVLSQDGNIVAQSSITTGSP
jgi:hypothetical protein